MGERDPPPVLGICAEGYPLQQIHYQIRASVFGRVALVDLQNVLVREAHAGAPLLQEPFQNLGITQEARMKNLDGDERTTVERFGGVHGTHSSTTELVFE